MNRNYVQDIREEFVWKLEKKHFVVDKFGGKVVEIVNASFLADEPTIFGEVNEDYVQRELAWYKSQSRNVNDIPGGPPEIWKKVAGFEGLINSNYGWMIWSHENGSQYGNVLSELVRHPESRRAVMIYTRPGMHFDWDYRGMSDFVCTNAVQYLYRDGALDAVVQMRSNDGWAGYRNDLAWQAYVLKKLAADLGWQPGTIHWNAGSLHFYQSQFYLLDWYSRSGETSIKRSRYSELYPGSEWK